jgi:hypothetical protein
VITDSTKSEEEPQAHLTVCDVGIGPISKALAAERRRLSEVVEKALDRKAKADQLSSERLAQIERERQALVEAERDAMNL